MIKLEIKKPYWENEDDPDDGIDQCAHGLVIFHVNELVISCEKDGEWNVTAAALFFLRTTINNHSDKQSVCINNFLIPCCGHFIDYSTNEKVINILGCNSGIDPTVEHEGNSVKIEFQGFTEKVTAQEWKNAVQGFASQVKRFYGNCIPRKEPNDKYERDGWDLFWAEWKTLETIN